MITTVSQAMRSSPWKPLVGLLTAFVHLYVCSPEINLLRCEMCTSAQEQKQKDLVKMRAEAGQSALLSAVKGILQGHVPGKKHNSMRNIKKKKSQIKMCRCTRGQRPHFRRLVPCSDETEMELFVAIMTVVTFEQ